MENKKALIIVGLVGLAGVGYYLYRKNKVSNNNQSTEEPKESGLTIKSPDVKVRESIEKTLGGKLKNFDKVTKTNEDKGTVESVFGMKTSTNPCGKKPIFPLQIKAWEKCVSNLSKTGSSGSGFDGYISHSNYSETDGILNEFDI